MRERRDRPTIIIIMGACGELGKDKRAECAVVNNNGSSGQYNNGSVKGSLKGMISVGGCQE